MPPATRQTNGLNCKQRRIFNPTFNPAEKCPVEIGFGRKSLLGQFSGLP